MGWTHLGLEGHGQPPEALNKYTGLLLVIGSGYHVWQELDDFLGGDKRLSVEKRLMLFSGPDGLNGFKGDVMAINDVGLFISCKLRHWASLHRDDLLTRYVLRQQIFCPPRHTMSNGSLNPRRTQLHSHKPFAALYPPFKRGKAQGEDVTQKLSIDHVWGITNTGGLSGLFGSKVGVLMGYEKVVMIGCPTDGSGRFFNPPNTKSCHGDKSTTIAWKLELNAHPILRARVRSVSGNTAEWLGKPTEEWLHG